MDSLSPASISAILRLRISYFSSASTDIFASSLFFCSSNCPYTVSLNSRGPFLSVSNSAWLK